MPENNQKTDQQDMEALRLQLETRDNTIAEFKTQARQNAAVAELGQRALVGTSISFLMNETVRLVAETLDVELSAVLEYDPNTETLFLQAGWGWQANAQSQSRVEATAESQAGYTLLSDKPVIVDNLTKETRFRPDSLLEHHQVISCISVVIRGRYRLFGILGVYATSQRTFTENDIHFVNAIANILATAVERKQSEMQLSQRNRELLILQSAIATITSSLDLKQVLTAVTGEMTALLNAEACTIFDWDQSNDLISMLASYPIEEGHDSHSLPVKSYSLSQFLPIEQVLNQQLVLQITTGQPLLEANKLSLLREHQTKTLLMLPMSFQGQITGLMKIMDSRVERTFAEQEITMAKLLANQAASAIENARLYMTTRKMLKEQLALREAATTISSTLDLNTVLHRIAEQIGQAIDATSTYIYDYKPETMVATVLAEHIGSYATRQEQISEVNAAYYLHRDFPSMIEFLESGQPKITQANDPNLTEFEQAYMERFGAQTTLTIPMQASGQVIAYAELRESRSIRKFTSEEIAFCQNMAQQAAIAIENARLHAETKQRAQHLSVLHELDRAITVSLRISDVYHAFARHATRLLPYNHMSIMLVEQDKVRVTYATWLNAKKTLPKDTTLPRQTSAAGWVVTHGQPLLRNNIANDMRFAEDNALISSDIQTHMIIPVRIKGKIIGTWNIGSQKVGAYSPDDLETAQAMADQLAIAVENARLFEQAQQEISERKRAEAALEEERALLAERVTERTAELSEANMELARAARLKDDFLASMSHELRTPLTAVLGLCDVLKMEVHGSLTKEQLKFVRNIDESGRHLLLLINDILDLSKIEAGKLELEIRSVSVQTICEASLQFIKQTAHNKQINVSLTIDEAVSIIQADQRRLKQILINLLSNAVKFTAGKGKVGIEVVGDPEKEQVHFTVWDTGIGIAQKDIAQLFQPFIQLDSRLARQYSGTGLGLALVQRMTNMHGGAITVESKVGQGSRFTVSLPWSKQTQIVKPIMKIVEPSPLVLGSRLDSYHQNSPGETSQPEPKPLILVAEDEFMLMTILTDFLRAKGYRINSARNGVEAIKKAKEERPDIILMDIQMPEMDGLEATRRLRQDSELATVPIIALTALAMPGDRERCLEAGANEYASKPLKLGHLVKLIEAQYNQNSNQKEKLH